MEVIIIKKGVSQRKFTAHCKVLLKMRNKIERISIMLLIISKKFCGMQSGEYTINHPVGEGRYGMCFLAHSISAFACNHKTF